MPGFISSIKAKLPAMPSMANKSAAPAAQPETPAPEAETETPVTTETPAITEAPATTDPSPSAELPVEDPSESAPTEPLVAPEVEVEPTAAPVEEAVEAPAPEPEVIAPESEPVVESVAEAIPSESQEPVPTEEAAPVEPAAEEATPALDEPKPTEAEPKPTEAEPAPTVIEPTATEAEPAPTEAAPEPSSLSFPGTSPQADDKPEVLPTKENHTGVGGMGRQIRLSIRRLGRSSEKVPSRKSIDGRVRKSLDGTPVSTPPRKSMDVSDALPAMKEDEQEEEEEKKKVPLGDKLKGVYEEVKGRVKKNPEGVAYGKALRTGDLNV